MSEIKMSKWFRSFETKYLTVGKLKKATDEHIADKNITDITKNWKYKQSQEEVNNIIGKLQ